MFTLCSQVVSTIGTGPKKHVRSILKQSNSHFNFAKLNPHHENKLLAECNMVKRREEYHTFKGNK